MATFKAQIEGVISQSLGTSPSADEVTQFLLDGVKDVVNRITQIKPEMGSLFSVSATLTDSTPLTVDSGAVAGVWRENGTTDDFEKAVQIDAGMKYRATDRTSLNYQSEYNPAWYFEGTALHVVPEPGVSTEVILTGVTATLATPTVLTKADHGLANGNVVKLSGFTEATELNGITGIVEGVAGDNFQIDGVYVDGAAETTGGVVTKIGGAGNRAKVQYVGYDSTVAHGSSTIANFPTQYEPLVVLYASFKSLLAYMSNIDNELPGDISLPVVPTAPTLTTSSVASLGDAPSYTQPVAALDISEVQTWITDDDPELASSASSKVQLQLSEYQANIQNELNKFNEANTAYQAGLQTKIQDAQLSSQDDAQVLQKYGADLQVYSAEVQAQLGDYSAKINKLNTKYQWAQGRYVTLRQEYNDSFGLLAPPKKGR